MGKDHHADVLAGATRQVQQLYETSPQGMYLYMDDEHKSCNKRFATMLGYRDAAEWEAIVDDIPAVFVHKEKDIAQVIAAFQAAVGQGIATTLDIDWRRKDGKPLRARTMLVPFDYDGHRMALHFIQPV